LLPNQSIPSSQSRPWFVEKLKKALVYVLLASGSSWGLFVPTVASAGFFSISSFLSGFTPQASASSETLNSQTVDLLSPANNIDPNPSPDADSVSVVGGSALLPQNGPSGTAADIEGHSQSSSISVHVVRQGENLSTIADMYGVSVNTIKWANDLPSGVIHQDQELVILPVSGVRHIIKKGDTVASLAKKYAAEADEIRDHNDISGELVVGEEILIPNGTIAAAPAPVKTITRSSGSGATVSAGGPVVSGYYGWPVNGGVVTQGVHGYNGIDIGAPSGTSIFASAGGVVVVARAGGYNGGYGSYVVIKHPNGTQTLYAHMSSVVTSPGATVAKGETIGRVGNTGKSTGFHLHFEVRGAANPFAR
jgi:LysM repeat protein